VELLNIKTNRIIDKFIIRGTNRKIMEENYASGQFINIQNLAEGAYIIQLIGKERNSTHRFIKLNR